MRKPSPALVVAIIALVVAMSGTAVASSLTTSKQINTITGTDIKDGSQRQWDRRPAKGSVTATASKTCSSGYTRAHIGGAVKCLRAGEFCARRYNRAYHRYGFTCRGGRLRYYY